LPAFEVTGAWNPSVFHQRPLTIILVRNCDLQSHLQICQIGNVAMTLNWFNSRKAADIGTVLAEQFVSQMESPPRLSKSKTSRSDEALQKILRRADREVRDLRLNFFQRAKFANSFKWKLLEKGVARETADEMTGKLLLHFSTGAPTISEGSLSNTEPDGPAPKSAKQLLAQGKKYLAEGALAEAIACYEELVRVDPHNHSALNNLGVALSKQGRYMEGAERFRQAIEMNRDFPEALSNLGHALRSMGYLVESEISLRKALKLNPRLVDARISLGITLVALNRVQDAKIQLKKALKAAPRNADALFGMALVARTEGNFDESRGIVNRILQVNPGMPTGLALLAGLRKMSEADRPWLERTEEVAASGISRVDEAEIRFAIGKYFDDIEDFKRAFQSYSRANELLKEVATTYDRGARSRYVDDTIRAFTRETIKRVRSETSASIKPVFVVGMPRSGTSLAEQIIASHPSAAGAGELEFWRDTQREHETAMQNGADGETARKKMAESYLRSLGASSTATRIVDKAPVNSDYLGVIHTIFPNARIIYMKRDPRDICLSCYFQNFSIALNFTLDLSDLAHYYREHHRLMSHWRAVLPPGSILDVPYEELVTDQEGWTRKILDFLGLEWDEHCLNFHTTDRPVPTASFWQVRQKLYKNSVQRWRRYDKFIGPLRGLELLDS
jgi:tetratricopeptide (TPR) repeat protein